MLPEIEKKYHLLETALTDILKYMDGLNETQLNARPPGAWSAVQILHHLEVSEAGTTGYLFKKLQTPAGEMKAAGISGMIRSYLLRRALRNYSKKFKAPARLGVMPDRPEYATVKSAILKNRKGLRSVMDSIQKNQVKKEYFNHPRAGRINILQTLDFLSDHMVRHGMQVKERSAAPTSI